MARLVDRWSVSTLLFFAAMKLLQTARRLGLRPREDGWRRATRAYLQTQQGHACMTSFGLDPWSAGGSARERSDPKRLERHLAERLRLFLAGRPEMDRRLTWGRTTARIVSRGPMDLVRVAFSGSGRLETIQPYLDGRQPLSHLDGDELDALGRELIAAYNRTLDAADRLRPFLLQRALLKRVDRRPWGGSDDATEARWYADRLLSAVWLCFEWLSPASSDTGDADPRAHLAVPDFSRMRGPGLGGFVIFARVHPVADAVDLWFHFHHSLADGAPFAELIGALEAEWSVLQPLLLPASAGGEPLRWRAPYSANSGRTSDVILEYVDFRPLLRLRKELNERHAGELGSDAITIAGLLVWGLSRHEVFRESKFTVVLDVPATQDRERTLGLAPCRPAAYADEADPLSGLLAFQRALSRLIAATRERRSESYELLESLALMPASIYPLAYRLLGKAMEETVGTTGISVIRNTSLVIPVRSDIHRDGFLGFGTFFVPTQNGEQLGAVTINGPPERLEPSMGAVRGVAAGDVGLPAATAT